jgi:hypothetical protein
MMQDLFYIIIDEKLTNYNKKTVSFKIKVKANNFKEFHKKYTDFLAYASPKINIYEKKMTEIGKAVDKRLISDKLKKEVSYVKIILEDLKNGFKKNCPEFYNDFIVFYDRLDHQFNEILSDNLVQEDFTKNNLEFLEWYSDKTRRKLEVCERLKTIEDTPLKALVIFDKNKYETHFTRYHLNLESYSDILHGLLKVELEEKFISEYKILEMNHFDMMKELSNNISLKNFLHLSSELMNNYEKMFRFPQQFLKVQFKNKKIEEDIYYIVDKHSYITEKLREIIKRVKLLTKGKKNILKAMTLFYEFPMERFEKFITEDVGKPKIIEFIINKEIKLDDEILLPILETIEPSLAEAIKNKILKVLKIQGQFDSLNKSAQFFMKKNKKSIFDNHQYYSHEMVTFQFLPQSHDEVKSKNQYLNTAGYEKIYREKKLMRIKSEVFSKVYGKKISYTVFIEFHYYMINPHISQRYA